MNGSVQQCSPLELITSSHSNENILPQPSWTSGQQQHCKQPSKSGERSYRKRLLQVMKYKLSGFILSEYITSIFIHKTKKLKNSQYRTFPHIKTHQYQIISFQVSHGIFAPKYIFCHISNTC